MLSSLEFFGGFFRLGGGWTSVPDRTILTTPSQTFLLYAKNKEVKEKEKKMVFLGCNSTLNVVGNTVHNVTDSVGYKQTPGWRSVHFNERKRRLLY